MSKKVEVNYGCSGCIGFIATVLVLWAFIFGVTVSGRHYDLSCSCDRGVVVE